MEWASEARRLADPRGRARWLTRRPDGRTFVLKPWWRLRPSKPFVLGSRSRPRFSPGLTRHEARPGDQSLRAGSASFVRGYRRGRPASGETARGGAGYGLGLVIFRRRRLSKKHFARASPGLDPIDLEGKGSWLTVGERKSDFFDSAAIEWGAGKLLPAELRGEGGEGHGHLGPLAKTTGLGQTLSDRSPESGPARPARIGGEAGKTTWQR